MYKIVLLSRAASAEAADEAGRCLAMISQAGGLDLEIELRDLDQPAAGHNLTLACLRADAVIAAAPAAGDAERQALDERLGLYAEYRPLHPASFQGEAADLLLVHPYGGATEADERLARNAFVSAEQRSKRVALVVDADNGTSVWREAAVAVAKGHPDVAFEILDAEAARLLIEARPRRFDVILTSRAVADGLHKAAGGAEAPATMLAGDSGPFVFVPGDARGSRATIAAAALVLWFAVDRPDLGTLLSDALDEAVAADHSSGGLGDRVQAGLAERLGARSAHLQLMAMNRGCCG